MLDIAPPAQPLTARIEVFRSGTFTPMNGAALTYAAADLRAIADAYDPETAPAPVVVGHPETDAPAYAWVQSFSYDARSDRLVATLHQIDPAFAEMVKTGRFKKVSMAFFGPDQPHNPVPGTWYPKHLGFLGAAAPAVSGLRNAKFAGAGSVTFTTAFGAATQTASVLRRLRDFLIDQFGLDDADKALPPWELDWLDQADDPPPSHFAAAEDIRAAAPTPAKEPAVPPTQPDPAFAAREAALASREADITTRETTARHADHAAFAERLVTEGRLLPASRDSLTAILDAAPQATGVSFAEGASAVPLTQALMDLLAAQPRMVAFGATDLGADPGTATLAAFAADGKAVDPAALAIHHKALAHQRATPGTAYLDAVRAVS